MTNLTNFLETNNVNLKPAKMTFGTTNSLLNAK